GSVAAVHQPPARSPGGGDQTADIAAAITVRHGAADIDARSTPAVVPAMPATLPVGRGGSRSQRRSTQRRRGNCRKRKFAKPGRLLKSTGAAASAADGKAAGTPRQKAAFR